MAGLIDDFFADACVSDTAKDALASALRDPDDSAARISRVLTEHWRPVSPTTIKTARAKLRAQNGAA